MPSSLYFPIVGQAQFVTQNEFVHENIFASGGADKFAACEKGLSNLPQRARPEISLDCKIFFKNLKNTLTDFLAS
jgi:hypothetical protein